jgi:Family of unknown function (DUF5670)
MGKHENRNKDRFDLQAGGGQRDAVSSPYDIPTEKAWWRLKQLADKYATDAAELDEDKALKELDVLIDRTLERVPEDARSFYRREFLKRVAMLRSARK